MKYVIVGNGIVALTTAFRLSKKIGPNDSIALIGPNHRKGSATLAAAAMLNSFAEIESHSLQTPAQLYHFELSHRATYLWPDFERELIDSAGDNLPDGCAKCQVLSGGCFSKGTFVINNTSSDETDDENFEAIARALEDFNEQFDMVDPRDIPNYKPAPRHRATRALLIHNEGWLNPRLVIEKLDAIIANTPSIHTHDARVARLVSEGGAITRVELEGGDTVEGDVFLLANGAAVGEVLENSNFDLPMQPVFYGVGVSIQIQAPGHPHKNCVRTPNRGGACGVYSVPMFLGPEEPDDHIVVGASNFIAPKPHNNGRLVSVAHLMESAINEINGNFYDAELIRVNVGWRPTSQDIYPLLGRTSIGNLLIATGTKRDGFHLSPVISQLMSSLMVGEEVEENLQMFAPERPVIRDMSREDAIEIGVKSLVSQHFQHGYTPSGVRMDQQIRDYFRADLEELHDKVGATDWGIHPEMINMYKRGFAK